MSTQANLTSDTLADDPQLRSADGEGAVGSSTLTLGEINSLLGTDFKDKDSALKSLKETKNFVGQRREDIEAQVRASLVAPAPVVQAPTDSVSKSEFKSLQDQLFYTQNPQFKEYSDVISTMGQNPAEVVETAAFKKVFAKVKVADEAEQSRSIVSSSPRLAANKTATDSAVTRANSAGATRQDVAELLAAAVVGEMTS